MIDEVNCLASMIVNSNLTLLYFVFYSLYKFWKTFYLLGGEMKFKKNKQSSKTNKSKTHLSDEWEDVVENVDKFSYKRGRMFEKAKDRTKKFKSRKYEGMDLEQYF